MKQFLKKDRWVLDFAAALVFAIGMSTGSQIVGDSWDGGQRHWDRILAITGIALASYTAVFLVGMAVRKQASFIRSWVWMSIVGALVSTVVLTITAIPMWLDYYRRFDVNAGASQTQYILSHLPGVLAYWVIWAISGAVFLVAVRFVGAFLNSRGQSTFN
jgi:hypothetical protein